MLIEILLAWLGGVEGVRESERRIYIKMVNRNKWSSFLASLKLNTYTHTVANVIKRPKAATKGTQHTKKSQCGDGENHASPLKEKRQSEDAEEVMQKTHSAPPFTQKQQSVWLSFIQST